MFASVWQLLTAIFFISALTKLVYKLVKEERAPNGLGVVVGHHQHQHQHELEQADERTERQRRHSGHQLTEVPEEGDPDEPNWRQIHNDDEARRRIAIRHLFRRQLWAHYDGQQVAAPGHQFESRQQARQQRVGPAATGSDEDTEDELEPRQAEHSPDSDEHQHDDERANTRHHQLATTAQRGQHGTPGSADTGHQLALITETLLIEPCKLIYQVLLGSLRLFCSILDSIEGIEHQNTLEQAEEPRRRQLAHQHLAQGRACSGRLQRTSQRLAATGSGRQQLAGNWAQPAERQAKAQGRGCSNYFHRRYFSRRSLSAALLDDCEPDSCEQRA